MIRDWHATYLTDPTVHAAARERCARTGEDGWAAAAALAPTMPPGFGSHESAGARAVLAPRTEPDDDLACLVPPGGRPMFHWQYATIEESTAAAEPTSDDALLINTPPGEQAFLDPAHFDSDETLTLPEWVERARNEVARARTDPTSLYWNNASVGLFQVMPRRNGKSSGHVPLAQIETAIRSRQTGPDPHTVVLLDEGAGEVVEQTWQSPEPNTLRHLLEQARDGAITLPDADDHPAIGEARRRRLVTEPSPALSGRSARRRARSRGNSGGTALLHLTELGKVELRRMRSADR